jgi:hypothetical protein
VGVIGQSVTGPASTADVVWTEGALDATSSSESSELKPSGGTSSMIGRGIGCMVEW